MSFQSTLSPAGPRMIGGLTRRSLISAVTAMSNTSSPNRRPLGQPPGMVPPPNPVWILLVSAQLADRDGQRHEMDVEAALRVLARRTQLEQIENGLNVRVKTVVTLAGESEVTVAQIRDRFPSVTIQVRFSSHAVLGPVFAIVALVVIRRGDALIVGRDDAS